MVCGDVNWGKDEIVVGKRDLPFRAVEPTMVRVFEFDVTLPVLGSSWRDVIITCGIRWVLCRTVMASTMEGISVILTPERVLFSGRKFLIGSHLCKHFLEILLDLLRLKLIW